MKEKLISEVQRRLKVKYMNDVFTWVQIRSVLEEILTENEKRKFINCPVCDRLVELKAGRAKCKCGLAFESYPNPTFSIL